MASNLLLKQLKPKIKDLDFSQALKSTVLNAKPSKNVVVKSCRVRIAAVCNRTVGSKYFFV